MVNTGTYGAYSGKTIGIQAAIQHREHPSSSTSLWQLTSALDSLESRQRQDCGQPVLDQLDIRVDFRFSQTSNSIFDSPSVDPGYLNHPADIQILREGQRIYLFDVTKQSF